jgi:dihydrofolate reductase
VGIAAVAGAVQKHLDPRTALKVRQLRYSVAASLDGYIAGPNGDFDWIVVDPDIDFEALYAGFSGLVMGRRSYDVFVATGGGVGPALPTYVYSRTLPEGERGGVTVVHDAVTHVRTLKNETGAKPLWLWGGGDLFRTLAAAGLVDGIDVAIIPVLLGDGIRLLPSPAPRLTLQLRSQRLYPKTGTVFVEYDVITQAAKASRRQSSASPPSPEARRGSTRGSRREPPRRRRARPR